MWQPKVVTDLDETEIRRRMELLELESAEVPGDEAEQDDEGLMAPADLDAQVDQEEKERPAGADADQDDEEAEEDDQWFFPPHRFPRFVVQWKVACLMHSHPKITVSVSLT